MTRCRTLVFDLYGRIARYREVLKQGGSGSRMMDSWRKVGWGFFRKDDLLDMRRKLKDENDRIMILLEASNA